MNVFSDSIKKIEAKYPDLLPDLRQGSIIFVASDYSGQHKIAQYETLSFLFADFSNCTTWDFLRKRQRQRFFLGGRRMAYKNLGDRKRRLSLLPFLNAANTIPGLIATILIDKRIESLFKHKGRLQLDDSELKKYEHWSRASLEKVLRVIHFVSFFIAGLSGPNQDLLWITDEDDIVANEERLCEMVRLFSHICSHYLSHNLRHIRIGTTKSDTGSRDIEDLVSVADLVAGALSQVLTEYRNLSIVLGSNLIVPPPQNLPGKTKEIMNWFADQTQPLKRLVYEINKVEGSTKLSLNYLQFHGSRDFAA